ncbi:MAG: D-aminoacyl-tRNA deacylase [Burkholderiaceae bacterium]
MIALLQRVSQAQVEIGGEVAGAIGPGLMTLVCAERDDTEADAAALLSRMIRYRVFSDEAGRMNRSLLDRQAAEQSASLLLVPQFTLAADTSSGLRPGFSAGASPEQARVLFDAFVDVAKEQVGDVQTGRFGADMQVSLTNDGPVTFWLRHPRRATTGSQNG